MVERELYERLVEAFRQAGLGEEAARIAANPNNEPVVRNCEVQAHEARQREAAQLGRQRQAATRRSVADVDAEEHILRALESSGLYIDDWKQELTHARLTAAPASPAAPATTSLHERTSQPRGEREQYDDISRRIAKLEEKSLI